jgi:hypothetical protein
VCLRKEVAQADRSLHEEPSERSPDSNGGQTGKEALGVATPKKLNIAMLSIVLSAPTGGYICGAGACSRETGSS